MNPILTIGHSTHTAAHLLELLAAHSVTAIADVRSVPASRFTPQFNRAALRRALQEADVKYVFLGAELGARPEDPSCYLDGRVQYDRLARTDAFRRGIERLRTGMEREQIAVMCTEQEPLDCHRTILISRTLSEQNIQVAHILGDGSLEPHAHAVQRLLAKWGLGEVELLRTEEERLAEAFLRQEQRIAYEAKESSEPDRGEA